MAAFLTLQALLPAPGYVLDAQYFYAVTPDSIGNDVVMMDDQFARAGYPSWAAKFRKFCKLIGSCLDFQRE